MEASLKYTDENPHALQKTDQKTQKYTKRAFCAHAAGSAKTRTLLSKDCFPVKGLNGLTKKEVDIATLKS